MQKIMTPNGETLVVLPLAEYEALIDAADIADAEKVRADIEAGRDEMVPEAFANRLMDGESPVRVWREYRGIAANSLAEKAGISAGYLSEMESGKKAGSVETLRKLADVLKLTIDDLI